MELRRAVKISATMPSLMSVINSAAYTLVLKSDEIDLAGFFDELLSRPSLKVKSRGKKKNLDKELRSGIYKIDIEARDQKNVITIWVSLGEPLNVRYDELLDLLEATDSARAFSDIYRGKLYHKTAHL